ncbi:P-aminobenzoate N-oxygenase AurF [Actinobacteria bacterium OV450]|nr:P-aminobenzoate N-oxygenase AurF [Actinobacteria bacterium OV450]
MSVHDLYAVPTDLTGWQVPIEGAARFTWNYDGRDHLLRLYQKGKDKQWDSSRRIDWNVPVNRYNALGMPARFMPIYESSTWHKINLREKALASLHYTAWQFSQFLHGEQGAMVCAARIIETVPDMDAKFFAATQAMDESRHAEIDARFLTEKIQLSYPINHNLRQLLDDTLRDSRWDMTFLGMQVLIEGLALAAFGVIRDRTTAALPRQILTYIMQDEARHVAFGRAVLREYYAQLTMRERIEREDFVIYGCRLMWDRFRGQEVWENLGYDMHDCLETVENSPYMQSFRSLLFNRIAPCVKDIGLWSPRIQDAYEKLGILSLANIDLKGLMRYDEDVAHRIEREESARLRELAHTISQSAGCAISLEEISPHAKPQREGRG